jgi:hypothetical protein
MALGPGKYDDVCTAARERASAIGALVVIFGGEKGDGFSMQATPAITLALPAILRLLADDVERDGLAAWGRH